MSDADASAQPKPVVWDGLRKAWAISGKDMKIYYFQPAVLIFGLVFPVAIFFAFMIGRNVKAVNALPRTDSPDAFLLHHHRGAVQRALGEDEPRTFERLLFAPGLDDRRRARQGDERLSLRRVVICLFPLAIGLIFFGSTISD